MNARIPSALYARTWTAHRGWHGFGPPVPELLAIGAELRALLRGEEPA